MKTKQKPRINKNHIPVPLWKGPYKDGISFSKLSKFVVCRERFRLLVIEGLQEIQEWNRYIEYGSMWHKAEESLAKSNEVKATGGQQQLHSPSLAIKKYCAELRELYPDDRDEINYWGAICIQEFEVYHQYWSTHKYTVKRKNLLAEQEFKVDYELPSGRTIKIKGIFDSVWLMKGTLPSIWLQENKVKGDSTFNEDAIMATLPHDLQTCMYLICLDKYLLGNRQILHNGAPAFVTGVIYNVIRRPLSRGCKYSIVKRKGRGHARVGAETDSDFIQRLTGLIQENREYFFHQYKCTISSKELKEFKEHVLNPLLENLCDWWEWVSTGDPWRIPSDDAFNNADFNNCTSVIPSVPGGGIHYQTPFGIYNSLYAGYNGEYFEYLTTGDTKGLKRIKAT